MPVVGDEDVGRLQIAVDHQPAVRVGHRVAHLQQQLHPRAQRQQAGAAVGVDRLALHVLQCQPGAAGFVHPGVVQPRDVRVLQRGQDVALARHALGQAARPGQARQLQRHQAFELPVHAARQPDTAHAAFTQLAQQPPRAHGVAERRRTRRGFGRCSRQFGQGFQEAAALGAHWLGQQVAQRVLQWIGGVEPF